MASRRIGRQTTAFLKLLHRCPPNQRKALVQYITDEQMDALSQIAVNILQGNIPITEDYKKKLRRYRDVIRSIASKQVGRARKKQTLLRFHTVIPLLIRPTLPLLDG